MIHEKPVILSFKYFLESLFSFAVFTAITIAVGSVAYQILNPDGILINWVMYIWNFNPSALLLMIGATILVKNWLNGTQGQPFADLLFYGAVLVGTYYGVDLFIAT